MTADPWSKTNLQRGAEARSQTHDYGIGTRPRISGAQVGLAAGERSLIESAHRRIQAECISAPYVYEVVPLVLGLITVSPSTLPAIVHVFSTAPLSE